jgi:hypothetical protein
MTQPHRIQPGTPQLLIRRKPFRLRRRLLNIPNPRQLMTQPVNIPNDVPGVILIRQLMRVRPHIPTLNNHRRRADTHHQITHTRLRLVPASYRSGISRNDTSNPYNGSGRNVHTPVVPPGSTATNNEDVTGATAPAPHE